MYSRCHLFYCINCWARQHIFRPDKRLQGYKLHTELYDKFLGELKRSIGFVLVHRVSIRSIGAFKAAIIGVKAGTILSIQTAVYRVSFNAVGAVKAAVRRVSINAIRTADRNP